MITEEYKKAKEKCLNKMRNELLAGETQCQPVSRQEIIDYIFDAAYNIGRGSSSAAGEPRFNVGDLVTVHLLNGKRLTGNIFEVMADGTYDVEIIDNGMMHNVTEACIVPYTKPQPYTPPKDINVAGSGIRLRIATAAMQGLLNATSAERFTLRIKPSAIAEAAVEYADALIEELKKVS